MAVFSCSLTVVGSGLEACGASLICRERCVGRRGGDWAGCLSPAVPSSGDFFSLLICSASFPLNRLRRRSAASTLPTSGTGGQAAPPPAPAATRTVWTVAWSSVSTWYLIIVPRSGERRMGWEH